MISSKPFLRPIDPKNGGGHVHRSGWPYVLRLMRPLYDSNATLIFDDFLEKTIFNKRIGLTGYTHKHPWVGVCHYPYDAPKWYETEHLTDLINKETWQQNLENLKLCITLGVNLASWITDNWKVPCVSLKHPTEIPLHKWSLEKFRSNDQPYLIQVGWYLRNTHAIFQVDSPALLKKAWLRSKREIAEVNHNLCAVNYAVTRKPKGVVKILEHVSNEDYDELLSKNVVFIELIAAVANNTIIECIARNTPIIVNKLPSTVYYLGKNYPLFYEDINEITELINMENIIAAHLYLCKLDKTWLSGSNFIEKFKEACMTHIPGL